MTAADIIARLKPQLFALQPKKRKLRIGNCPVCRLSITVVGKDKTPRHGHIKWETRWLPPCSGSGKVADNLYP